MIDRKLIFVEWHDAFGVGSDWQEITDVVKETKPLLVRSVGWEVHRDNLCLVIVPHLSDIDHDRSNQQGCGDMTIPVACIVHEQEIKLDTEQHIQEDTSDIEMSEYLELQQK